MGLCMSISSLRKEKECLEAKVSTADKKHKNILSVIQDLEAQKVKKEEELERTIQTLTTKKNQLQDCQTTYAREAHELSKTRKEHDRQKRLFTKDYQESLRMRDLVEKEKEQALKDVETLTKDAEGAKTLAAECEARVGTIIEAIEAKARSFSSGKEDEIADHKIVRLALIDGSHLDIRAGVLRKNSVYFAGLLEHPQMISRDPDNNIFVEGNPSAMRSIFMAMQGISPPRTEDTKLEWLTFLHRHPHFIPLFRQVFEGKEVEGLSEHYSKKVQEALTSLYDFLRTYSDAYEFYLILPDVRETVIGKVFDREQPNYLHFLLDEERISLNIYWDCHLTPLEPGAYTLLPMTHPKMVKAQRDLWEIIYDSSYEHDKSKGRISEDFWRAKWGEDFDKRSDYYRHTKESFTSFQKNYSPSKDQVGDFVKDKMMKGNKSLGFLEGIRDGFFVLCDST